MAALLRSGKFLRLVTGIARPGQAPPTTAGPANVNGNSATTTLHHDTGLQLPTDIHSPFHTWSLHHLQGALPMLSSSVGQDDNESPVKSDPLKEFLIEQQKLTDDGGNVAMVKAASAEVKEGRQSRKVVRKSLCNEVVGFDAIKEEEDTSDSLRGSVVVKAAVTASVSPKKPLADKLINDTSKVATSSLTKVQQETSTQTEENAIKNVDTSALSPPPKTVTTEYKAPVETQPIAAGPAEVIPAPSFVPMVQVVEDQVTQWYPLHVVCAMFRDQGRVNDLENLLWGAVGIRPEDRKLIFFWTLQSYSDLGLVDRAIALSKRLEWEGLANDFAEFHSLFRNLITTYAYPMPHLAPPPQSITYPSSAASTPMSTTPYTSCPGTPMTSSSEEMLAVQAHYHRKLKKAFGREDAAEALAAYRELEKTGKQINVTEMSSLVELLVKDEMLADASSITESMLRSNTYPLPKIFRFLLNRLASTGCVEHMNNIGRYLSTSVKKEVSFDNRLCNAYLAAGRGDEYLNSLEIEVDAVLNDGIAATPEQQQAIKEKFPRGGAMGLLESDPNLVDQYTRLAHKFLTLGFVAPINVLWTYHFISGRYDLAAPLWETHVKTCPQIMFQKVCQTARSTGNSELAWRLVDLLHTATVTQGARGIAYSCLLDVLSQKGAFSEGCQALQSAVDHGVLLTDINRTALKRLKEGVEAEGQVFPYEIPRRVAGDTMSECESEISNSMSTSTALMTMCN